MPAVFTLRDFHPLSESSLLLAQPSLQFDELMAVSLAYHCLDGCCFSIFLAKDTCQVHVVHVRVGKWPRSCCVRLQTLSALDSQAWGSFWKKSRIQGDNYQQGKEHCPPPSQTPCWALSFDLSLSPSPCHGNKSLYQAWHICVSEVENPSLECCSPAVCSTQHHLKPYSYCCPHAQS